MIAVVFDAPDMYLTASSLLDRGFATPVAAEAGLDRLPDVVPDAAIDPPEVVPGAIAGDLGPIVPAGSAERVGLDSPAVAVAVLLLGTAPAIALRRRLTRGPRRVVLSD